LRQTVAYAARSRRGAQELRADERPLSNPGHSLTRCATAPDLGLEAEAGEGGGTKASLGASAPKLAGRAAFR
jgi:hypothetical protein